MALYVVQNKVFMSFVAKGAKIVPNEVPPNPKSCVLIRTIWPFTIAIYGVEACIWAQVKHLGLLLLSLMTKHFKKIVLVWFGFDLGTNH